MFRVHVISDLNLKFNEFTPENELNIPNVELVILNGNIAKNPKRGMLYAEQLCAKYPETQFVYNYGFYERFPIGIFPKSKYGTEILNATKTRSNLNDQWPKNLHVFIDDRKILKLRNGHIADVYCAFGFPKILRSKTDWESSYLHRNCIIDTTRDIHDSRITLPEHTSKVSHGDIPVWATIEWFNEQNKLEFQKVRSWELNYNAESGYKILAMHMNPIKDTRCIGLDVDYFDIHLNQGLWLGSDTPIDSTLYLGAKYISNPGRGAKARSLVFTAQRV